MPQTFVSDSELAHRLQTGDQDAFEQIYDRYGHKLYRMAFSKVKASENVKEIIQDVFVDLWFRRT